MAKKLYLSNIDLKNSALVHGSLEDIGIEMLPTPPSDPRRGYLYFNYVSGQIGVFNGAEWVYAEPAFIKNTAFNKNFGTEAGTVAEGNDQRIINGQEVYQWWVDGGKDSSDKADEHIANNDIHVTKEQKDFWQENTTYTNSEPILVQHGGIVPGVTFDNKPMSELMTEILYPYVPPTIELTCGIPAGVYEIGTSQNNVLLSARTVRKSKDITGVNFLLNGSVINTPSFTPQGGTSIYEIPQLKESGTYSAEVTDGESTIQSTSYKFEFVYPLWIGSISSEKETVENDDIKSLYKRIISKGNVTYNFNLDFRRMCIACPPEWSISQIFDKNGFDITASFAVSQVAVECADNSWQNYMVYLSNPTTQSNFTVTFKV